METIIGAEMETRRRLTGIHPILFSDGVPILFSDGVPILFSDGVPILFSVFALIGDIVTKIKNACKKVFVSGMFFIPSLGGRDGGAL